MNLEQHRGEQRGVTKDTANEGQPRPLTTAPLASAQGSMRCCSRSNRAYEREQHSSHFGYPLSQIRVTRTIEDSYVAREQEMIIELGRRAKRDLGEPRQFGIAWLAASFRNVRRDRGGGPKDLRTKPGISPCGVEPHGEMYIESESMGLLPHEELAEIAHPRRIRQPCATR